MRKLVLFFKKKKRYHLLVYCSNYSQMVKRDRFLQ